MASDSVLNILIDACTRLASVSDVNMIMVMDTSEGRRYTGKEYLCQIYQKEGLLPQSNDVKMSNFPLKTLRCESCSSSWEESFEDTNQDDQLNQYLVDLQKESSSDGSSQDNVCHVDIKPSLPNKSRKRSSIDKPGYGSKIKNRKRTGTVNINNMNMEFVDAEDSNNDCKQLAVTNRTELLNDKALQVVEEFLCLDPKSDIVQNMMFDKSKPIDSSCDLMKVLQSLIHDVSKIIVVERGLWEYRSTSSKEILNHAFDLFWNFFHWMEECFQVIGTNSSEENLKTYVKNYMQKMLRKCSSNYISREQTKDGNSRNSEGKEISQFQISSSQLSPCNIKEEFSSNDTEDSNVNDVLDADEDFNSEGPKTENADMDFCAFKNTRRKISLSLKHEIIQTVEKGMKPADAMRKFKLPTSTLHSILKNRQKIKKDLWNSKCPSSTERVFPRPFAPIENFIMEWLNQMNANGLTINGPMIKQKALEVAPELGFPEFTGSDGWLSRFKQKHHIFPKLSKRGKARKGFFSNSDCNQL